MKTRSALSERCLSGLAAEVRVDTCAMEVNTLQAELAQTKKILEHVKEKTAHLRTQVYGLKAFPICRMCARITGIVTTGSMSG